MNLLKRALKFLAELTTPCSSDYSAWRLKNFFLRLAGINIAHDGVAISSGFKCLEGLEHNVYLNSYVSIGNDVKIYAFNKIELGEFCMIAAGVTLTNGWHEKSSLFPQSAPMKIGAGTWIGMNATIIGGVVVGKNVIIGAGALVNRDIPDNSVAVGVPARVVETRELSMRMWHLNDTYFCPATFEILKN